MNEFHDKEFCLEVWGEFACFTRPEMKVERVSYDVITPSAARSVFEAIFWKPAIHWQVTRIEVLNPVKWISVRRNEVASLAKANKQVFIEESRQQRAGLFLQNVRYRLYAELQFIPVSKRMSQNKEGFMPDENPAKYNAMFERRARNGQCFTQPYLGCREFTASFKLIDNPQDGTQPIDVDTDLGFMLYDMDFSDPQNIQAMFYRPHMHHGVIMVPPVNSEEVLK